MYQRVDFSDWTVEEADQVLFFLEQHDVLEDYEIIEGADGKCCGFYEFIEFDPAVLEEVRLAGHVVTFDMIDPDTGEDVVTTFFSDSVQAAIQEENGILTDYEFGPFVDMLDNSNDDKPLK